jgi:hypothetical protein
VTSDVTIVTGRVLWHKDDGQFVLFRLQVDSHSYYADMPRAVLVDLPLERFLQPISDDVNLPTPLTGSKRSRSPSLAHSIFSPAKRRILEQEGLFPPSHSRPYSSINTHSLRPRRRALLHGLNGSKHPLEPSPAGSLTTLPSTPDPHPSLLLASPCEPRRISPRLSALPQSQSPSAPTTPTRTSPRRRTRSQTMTAPTMIPREMPPSPDRRSAHYPGFDIHLDTHIALPCTRSRARAKEEAARVQEGGEAAKENVRPVMVSPASSKGKIKGDATPRRSARLRTNNGNTCSTWQKVVVLETRGRDRRRSTLHDSSLQF